MRKTRRRTKYTKRKHSRKHAKRKHSRKHAKRKHSRKHISQKNYFRKGGQFKNRSRRGGFRWPWKKNRQRVGEGDLEQRNRNVDEKMREGWESTQKEVEQFESALRNTHVAAEEAVGSAQRVFADREQIEWLQRQLKQCDSDLQGCQRQQPVDAVGVQSGDYFERVDRIRRDGRERIREEIPLDVHGRMPDEDQRQRLMNYYHTSILPTSREGLFDHIRRDEVDAQSLSKPHTRKKKKAKVLEINRKGIEKKKKSRHASRPRISHRNRFRSETSRFPPENQLSIDSQDEFNFADFDPPTPSTILPLEVETPNPWQVLSNPNP